MYVYVCVYMCISSLERKKVYFSQVQLLSSSSKKKGKNTTNLILFFLLFYPIPSLSLSFKNLTLEIENKKCLSFFFIIYELIIINI